MVLQGMYRFPAVNPGVYDVRILVATYYTIPGISGGWTTPLDLLQCDHDVAYAVNTVASGSYVLEGVPVYGSPAMSRMQADWPILNRLRVSLQPRSYKNHLKRSYRRHRADFVLCLDEISGITCRDAGIPFALRFHSPPSLLPQPERLELQRAALFTTCVCGVEIPGAIPVPHGIDLSRFTFTEHEKAERVVMVATLVDVELPDLFIEGVRLSSLEGVIVGDGPLRPEVERLCSESRGKVEYMKPVMRLDLPRFLSQFQIGAACCRKIADPVYQMKITEYQGAGIFPLVMPWVHLNRREPDLTRIFTSARELAEQIDWLASHWSETVETRHRNREFAIRHYDITEIRRLFQTILVDTFGVKKATSRSSS
jgi:hypothetical protein